MPVRLPLRRPLAMSLWLARRFGRAGKAGASAYEPGHLPGKAPRVGSIEHLLQNRVRLFLRHPWVVTVLGAVILAGVVGLGIYVITQGTVMRIAAGPEGGIDAKL